MIYRLIHDQDTFELNPGLKAVEEYAKLTDKQIKYVILVCDPSHDNPVRTLQGKEKKEKAALLAGYKKESDNKRLDKNARDVVAGNNPNIEKAIVKFKELHFDEKRDLLETLDFQINEIRDFLKEKKEGDPKKLKAALEFGTKLPEIVEAKLKIEGLLNVSTNIKPDLGEGQVEIEMLNNASSLMEDGGEDANLSTIDLYNAGLLKAKE